MVNEYVKKSFIVIILALLSLFAVNYSIKYYESRKLCNRYRESIISAETTNRELREAVRVSREENGELRKSIEQCQSICGELGNSVERNINSARDAIELLEEIREEVQELEIITGNWNSDNYYNYWDSILLF